MQLKESLNPGEILIIAATSGHLPAWIGGRGRSPLPGLGPQGKGCSDTAHDCPFAVPQLAVCRTTDLKAKSENKSLAAQLSVSMGVFGGEAKEAELVEGPDKFLYIALCM